MSRRDQTGVWHPGSHYLHVCYRRPRKCHFRKSRIAQKG